MKCLKCDDENCEMCPGDIFICTKCKLGLGVDENHQCSECVVD